MELPSGNAAEAAQRFLDEAFKDAKTAADTYGKRASRRRMLAYGLKGIALFGGLFVAVVQSHPAIMGVVISAAVLVDQLMSNHQRLITEQVAVNAVQHTLRRIETDYNDQVLAVIEATSKEKTQRHRIFFRNSPRPAQKRSAMNLTESILQSRWPTSNT